VDDTTQGYVCFSARAREFFTKNYTTINKIAARIASAYSSLADDLIQEGLIALYTDLERKLDRGFDPGREEWRGYVKVVLRRAISRAAKKLIKGDEFLGQPARGRSSRTAAATITKPATASTASRTRPARPKRIVGWSSARRRERTWPAASLGCGDCAPA
jgi:DNA-directed RNA polymerase specialized sigma24 family protein